MLRLVLDKFWDEDVWLPPNTTWEDIAPGPDKSIVYADHRHLLYPLPLALVLIALRHILDKYVITFLQSDSEHYSYPNRFLCFI